VDEVWVAVALSVPHQRHMLCAWPLPLQTEEHRQEVDHLNTAKALLVQELETAQSKLTSQVCVFVCVFASVIAVPLCHNGDIDDVCK